MGQLTAGRRHLRAVVLATAVCVVATVLGGSVAANAALPTLPSAPTLDPAPLGIALDSTVKTVQDLLAAVATAQAELQAAAASLQTRINTVVAAAQADPASAPDALQAAALGSVGDAESRGLKIALLLAEKATQSVCPTLGAAAAETADAAVPTMPDYSLFGPLAGVARRYDQTAANDLYKNYVKVFAKLLSPIALPEQLSPASPYVTAAQALLKLLYVNWHSTYYPASGGTPVVRDTPGFLHLPSLLDVDGNLGFDVCARLDVDFSTSAINLQIDRIPLANASMRATIQGQVLNGVIAPGYETPEGSHIPAMFDSAMNMSGKTYTSTVIAPGPSFVQTLNLTSALQHRVESEGTPSSYTLTTATPGGTTGTGTVTNWAASSQAKSFSYAMAISTLLLGVGASDPAPSAFEYCTSSKGFCSNQPGADVAASTPSMHFIANAATKVSQFTNVGNKNATTCGSVPVGEAHLRGTKLSIASKTSSPGFAWFDTADLPIEGCLAAPSTTGSLPTGTSAAGRLVTFAGAGTAPPVTATSGTMNCPAGLALSAGSFGLARYLCAADTPI